MAKNLTAERLKLCRTKNNKTLDDIGNLLGVHKSTVSRWENGETDRIGLSIIGTLAEYYNVSAAWLSGKDVPMAREYDANKEYEEFKSYDDDIKLIARKAKKMTPEQRQKLIDMSKVLFGELFDDNET